MDLTCRRWGAIEHFHQGEEFEMVSEASYPGCSANSRDEESHVQCDVNKTVQERLRVLAGTSEGTAEGRVSMGTRPGHRGSMEAPGGQIGWEEPTWKCAPSHWTGAPWNDKLTWSPADAETGPPREPVLSYVSSWETPSVCCVSRNRCIVAPWGNQQAFELLSFHLSHWTRKRSFKGGITWPVLIGIISLFH